VNKRKSEVGLRRRETGGMATKRCMNTGCMAVSPGGEWRKGWAFRAGGFAILCDKCGYGLSCVNFLFGIFFPFVIQFCYNVQVSNDGPPEVCSRKWPVVRTTLLIVWVAIVSFLCGRIMKVRRALISLHGCLNQVSKR
jgi:hypothetical protein